MLRHGVAAWPVTMALLYVTPLLTAPDAAADNGLGTGARVSCAAGGCDVRAEVRGRPAVVAGGRSSTRSRRSLVQHGGGAVSGPPTISSDGWEYGLGNGLGILPRFDGRGPKKPEPKHQQRVPVQVVARRAVEKLTLPKPVIRMSPHEDVAQVVGVPTWMWVEHGTWRPVAETAEVPGLKVTATARPVKAVWSMGEGGTVMCAGPGTAYSETYRGEEPSPDCGYTYRVSSLSEPEQLLTVSVQVTWDVEWRGGGRSGRVPGLVIAAERPLVVDEVQALVVR